MMTTLPIIGTHFGLINHTCRHSEYRKSIDNIHYSFPWKYRKTFPVVFMFQKVCNIYLMFGVVVFSFSVS